MNNSVLLDNDLITPKEASELTGYTASYVTSLARTHKIQGQHRSRTWLIDQDSLLSFASAHKRTTNIHRTSRLLKSTRASYTPQSVSMTTDRRYVDFAPVVSQAISLTVAFLVVMSAAGVAQSPYFLRLLSGTGLQVLETSASVRAAVGSIPEQVTSTVGVELARFQVGAAPLLSEGVALLWGGYVSLGRQVYLSVVQMSLGHQALVLSAGDHALVLGNRTVEVLQYAPRAAEKASISLGAFVIEASHAVIAADVSLAYYLASATPVAAHTFVGTVGSFGTAIANETASVSVRLVATFGEAGYQYLAFIERAGEGAYASSADLSRLIVSLPSMSEIAGVIMHNAR